jgi:hypothetical protein
VFHSESIIDLMLLLRNCFITDLIRLPGVVLKQARDSSSWHGTELSTGTTLLLLYSVPLASSCEQGNEPSSSIKGGEFLG